MRREIQDIVDVSMSVETVEGSNISYNACSVVVDAGRHLHTVFFFFKSLPLFVLLSLRQCKTDSM